MRSWAADPAIEGLTFLERNDVAMCWKLRIADNGDRRRDIVRLHGAQSSRVRWGSAMNRSRVGTRDASLPWLALPADGGAMHDDAHSGVDSERGGPPVLQLLS
jgi:hypothetical protein